MTGGRSRAAIVAVALAAWAAPAVAADGGVEVCNGKDDDGDGDIDEDFPLGLPCRPPAVPELARESRGVGECRDGHWECEFFGPAMVCAGGVGPVPEQCDGLDNDCDGVVDDEAAIWPQGLSGVEDPANPPRRFIAPCGNQTEPCRVGRWHCVDGKGACVGGVPPKPEICDGIDNDCNGQPDDAPQVCAADRSCIPTEFGYQCAAECAKNADCDGGECQPFPLDDGGSHGYCVVDRCANCGSAVVAAPDGGTLCAPFESAQGGLLVPECECLGQGAGCGRSCPSCPIGTHCLGLAGNVACVPETNCYYFGCFSGQACHGGHCVDDPCSPNPCKRSEACRPTRDFGSHLCFASCAGVACAPNQRCEDGVCVDTGCAESCEAPLVCRGDRGCAPSGCPKNGRCGRGEFCEPETGKCLDAPCEAVACPAGQRCEAGQCIGPVFQEPRDAAPEVDASVDAPQGAPDAGATQENDAARSAPPVAPAAAPESSCGCRVSATHANAAFWLLGVLLLAIVRRRARALNCPDTSSCRTS